MPTLINGLNVSLTAPFFNPDIEVLINEEKFVLSNLNKYLEVFDLLDDVKFESGAYWSHHYGFESEFLHYRSNC